MNIIVTPELSAPTIGLLICGTICVKCALGKNGVGTCKSEGDNKTPLGQFPLRRIFYRADRLAQPKSGLPVIPLKSADGWCDAPDDVAYNTFISHPHRSSAENLWRRDKHYNIVAVIGYNDDPVISGKGSAIFLHVATDDFRPTKGCIAIQQPDLLSVLSLCTPETTVTILPPKA
ncbi:MAG: L,D-transpeptidase [Rhodospirillaceae bacterium]